VRKFLLFVSAFASLQAGPSFAAESYPNRPVRVIVPFAPGGTSDIMARVVSQQLSEQLGQTFVVDNRAGASGLIGHGMTAKATPDGYTIATVDGGFAIVPSVKKELPYDPLRDFTFITEVMAVPRAMVIRPALKTASLKEFIDYARANPGKVSYASGGPGGINHLAGELFNMAAKVKLVQVPYKGAGAATNGVLTNETDMVIAAAPTVVPHVKSGRLRALGVTTDAGKRFAGLPEVPSFADAGLSGMVIYTWFGFLGPAKMPKAIVDKLTAEVRKAIASPAVKDRLQGAEMIGAGSAEFTKLMASDMKRWAGVVKAAGIQPE